MKLERWSANVTPDNWHPPQTLREYFAESFDPAQFQFRREVLNREGCVVGWEESDDGLYWTRVSILPESGDRAFRSPPAEEQ